MLRKHSAECNEDSYLAILHLSSVELHCKLQEKLHRVTWPYVQCSLDTVFVGKYIRLRDAGQFSSYKCLNL